MPPPSTLTLRCHPIGTGWEVTIVDHDGPGLAIRRLDQIRKRARTLLENHCGPDVDVDELEVQVQVVAPLAVAAAVTRAIDASERAADLQDEASHATRDAVRLLVNEEGLSLRDTGILLGLTYERVRQLNASEEPGRAPRASGPTVQIVSEDQV